MMFYIVVLSLGLMFIYSVRDGLLVLQNRRDAKAELAARAVAANTSPESENRCDERFSA